MAKRRTADEWNELANDVKILDWDGFRDGTITRESLMTRAEFLRRRVKSTVRFLGIGTKQHAAALGKLGGAAGKGSPARRRAALKANRTRWRNHRKSASKIIENNSGQMRNAS